MQNSNLDELHRQKQAEIQQKMAYLKERMSPEEYEEFSKKIENTSFGRKMTEEEKAYYQERLNKDQRKYNKRFDKSFKHKNSVLLFLSKVFTSIFTILCVLWTIAGLANIYFVYQIYKVCQVSGWHGIIETKWSLYIVAYIIIYYVLKQAHYRLYKYSR